MGDLLYYRFASCNIMDLPTKEREMQKILESAVNDLIFAELSGDKFKYALKHDDGRIWEFTLRIGGKRYRCKCGANVLHKPIKDFPNVYKCNGCGSMFETE